MSLHRALDRDGPIPPEWLLSRFCEEFHCLPSAAMHEWLILPAGTLETILEFRAYARAKVAYDHASKITPADPMRELVTTIAFELVAEARL